MTPIHRWASRFKPLSSATMSQAANLDEWQDPGAALWPGNGVNDAPCHQSTDPPG